MGQLPIVVDEQNGDRRKVVRKTIINDQLLFAQFHINSTVIILIVAYSLPDSEAPVYC